MLQQALIYSNVLFLGAPLTWLSNSLVSVVRGSGNIRFSALLIVGATLIQVVLGAGLGLGLGPFPRWGMAGVALGQVLAASAATVAVLLYLRSPLPRVQLVWRGMRLQRESFAQILRIGLLAALSPVQNVLTVLVLTGLVARLGVDALAGYGIGARLEFLLLPLSFGVGVTLVPMVGMALGRGDVARARRVAWTGGLLAAAVVGTIGLWACIWPHAWASLFTDQPQVLAHAELYLRWAGPGFAFYGLGITLYFASQGAGQVLGPVLGATMRLAVIALGGAVLWQSQAPAWAYFALVAAAMVAYGLFNAAALARTDWRRATPAPLANDEQRARDRAPATCRRDACHGGARAPAQRYPRARCDADLTLSLRPDDRFTAEGLDDGAMADGLPAGGAAAGGRCRECARAGTNRRR